MSAVARLYLRCSKTLARTRLKPETGKRSRIPYPAGANPTSIPAGKKCKDCRKQFLGGRRRDKNQVITDYIEGKQTLAQLAVKYGVNEKTIRRDLEGMRYVHKIAKYKDVTVQMDTTCRGRDFGLMVIRDALRGNVLWHKYDRHETISPYMEGWNG